MYWEWYEVLQYNKPVSPFLDVGLCLDDNNHKIASDENSLLKNIIDEYKKSFFDYFKTEMVKFFI